MAAREQLGDGSLFSNTILIYLCQNWCFLSKSFFVLCYSTISSKQKELARINDHELLQSIDECHLQRITREM